MTSLLGAARTELSSIASLKKSSSVMATFVLPALVTVWVAMPSLNWFDISKWVFFAVLAVLAAGWILLGYLSGNRRAILTP